MEKKKILLVTVSVGIFLVIAIGAAILLFTPAQAASGSAVVMQPGAAGSATIQRPAGTPPPALPAGEPAPAPEIFEAPLAAEHFSAGQNGEPPAPPAETRFTEESYFVIDAEPSGSALPAGPEGQVRISVARPISLHGIVII
jgi:hypothetical protein